MFPVVGGVFLVLFCLWACGLLAVVVPWCAETVAALATARRLSPSRRRPFQFDYVKRRRKRRDRNRRNTIGDTREIAAATLRDDLPR